MNRERDVPPRRADQQHEGTDPLTGLPTRDEIVNTVDDELARRPEGEDISVLVVDIDGFREFNDALGPERGDELLRLIADRLTDSTRDGDLIGRLTGDEFVVIAQRCQSLAAQSLAAGFTSVFEPPFRLGDREFTLTASVGVATTDGDPITATDLIHNATAAMHAAKTGGRSQHHIFTADLRTSNRTRLDLVERLRGIAMVDRELEMIYQPIVDLSDGTVIGAEALIRWNHPNLGLLLPDSFIPLSEDAELIVPLSNWIIDEVAHTLADWQSRGIDLQIGVNISAAHFAAGTLATDVVGTVNALGIEPRRLVLEVAESRSLHDIDAVRHQLDAIRRAGVLIAIDDFGSGFSSLERLATLPVDILKIDKSLTQHLDSDDLRRRRAMTTLCRAVVDLTHALGKNTVIEGIETEQQLVTSAAMGVTFGQGHLLGRPMPIAALEQLITRPETHSASA